MIKSKLAAFLSVAMLAVGLAAPSIGSAQVAQPASAPPISDSQVEQLLQRFEVNPSSLSANDLSTVVLALAQELVKLYTLAIQRRVAAAIAVPTTLPETTTSTEALTPLPTSTVSSGGGNRPTASAVAEESTSSSGLPSSPADATATSPASHAPAPTATPTSGTALHAASPEPASVPLPTQSAVPGLSNDNQYVNSSGTVVHSPAYSDTVPAAATAQCRDGTYSFSQHRRGTCSHHGGVARWLE